MSQSFHIHCVWSLEQRAFVLSVDTNSFKLSPTQFKTTLEDAEQQSARQGGFGDLDMSFGPDGGGYKFTGFDIKQLVEYLRKVYDGWERFTFAKDGQNQGKNKP